MHASGERALGAIASLAALLLVALFAALVALFAGAGVAGLGRGAAPALGAAIAGTMLVATIAVLIAAPLGLAAATYLSELASARERRIWRPLLAAFASVPGVALGWLAWWAVAPALAAVAPWLPARDRVAAGVVIGAMSIPLVSSLCEDALAAVPRALREAGWALGVRPAAVIVRVVWPAARAGLAAAVLLAAARAVGETMIVWIATRHAATLSASMADAAWVRGDLDGALMIGTALVSATAVLHLLAHRLVRRVRSWS